MPAVVIYTKPLCPYCIRAVGLFEKKGLPFQEISAAFDPEKRGEMVSRSGGRTTFPQIFIGDAHVGGCDDLMTLERSGGLEKLLTE